MKTLILSFSNIHKDPRVLRQLAFFNSLQNSKVFLSGISYRGEEEFIPLMKRERTLFEKMELIFFNLFKINTAKERKFLQLINLKDLESILVKNSIDVVLANDLETWPVVFALGSLNKNIKIILDAHEYYPLHFEDKLIWKLMHSAYYNYICDKYISRADKFITVATGIKKAYDEKFGIKSSLILNSPDFIEFLTPKPVETRKIKLIHHGIANSSRRLEKMIMMMDYLDSRFHLYLMLMPTDQSYLIKLKNISKGKRITFLDPVPTTEISGFINQFDIGVFLLEPVNFNYANALPNKFFEFIQARLAIAIGPSTEMKHLVLEEKNGVVAKSFDEKELSEMLNSLSNEQIQQMKERSHQAAWNYSNQLNEKTMLEILKELNLVDIQVSVGTTN